MMRHVSALLVLFGLALPAQAAPAAGPFRVVINAANPATGMAHDDVARAFLKKATTWPSGQPIVPVDQLKESVVRKAFSAKILGKDVPAVESYWQQAIFSGRAVPPSEKASDAEVLAFVRATPNAVGYVSGSGDLGPDVKELAVQ